MNQLVSVSSACDLIRSGAALAIAGDESCLDRLPEGNWIGGTIPYFMGAEGGVKCKDRVFVTVLPADATVRVRHYATADLAQVVADTPDNGFSIVIIPASSTAHARYAEDCRGYDGAFLKPVAGWIAGVDLDLIGQVSPKVYDGSTGVRHADGAVVAAVALPAPRLASIEIVNVFEPEAGDVIRFPRAGFAARDCTVNGEPVLLSAYLAIRGLADGRRPLVGDFAGASANVSFQKIDVDAGIVHFYAPVFTDVEYRIAKPLFDYAAQLEAKMRPFDDAPVAFSCNCILNFVYGGLEGRRLGKQLGPVTFGEIGDQLLNQTFVAVRID